MTLPTFPFTEVKEVTSWSNFHGTIRNHHIPVFCTPGTTPAASVAEAMAHHGKALDAIVGHCFASRLSLRVLGSTWSLSNIVLPGTVTIDPGHINKVTRVSNDLLTTHYLEHRAPAGFVPFYAQGGTRMAQLNQQLAPLGLALQTSGASDGHRVAGCVATGTHGSAIHVGAVHDTILGVHLLVAPGVAKLVVPGTHPAITQGLATWLTERTGIDTKPVENDELFAAALVSLGSLGVVMGVVVEATKLYRLKKRVVSRPRVDPAVWAAIRSTDASAFHHDISKQPHHFQVTFNPYASPNEEGAFVTLMWKQEIEGGAHDVPLQPEPQTSSDTMELLGKISEDLDGPLSAAILGKVLAAQIRKRMPTGDFEPRLPGSVFGPVSLPPGFGASTEIIVSRANAEQTLKLVLSVLDSEAHQGRHFTGLVSVRFVPKTRSLLGMNIHDMNCHVELPGIRNDEIAGIFGKCFQALEAAHIPFTCHWGQLHAMHAKQLRNYFGDRVDRWKAARDALLPDALAKTVFSSPLLREVGLQ